MKTPDHTMRAAFIKYAVVAAALLGLSLTARATDFQTDFEQANQLYDQGKFESAERLYGSIVNGDHYSPQLFYNLGNAEFRLKKPGLAILNYERALALAPNQPEARANLAYAREQTGAEVGTKNWRDRIVADLDLNTYSWVAACAGWICIFALGAIFLKVGSGNLGAWVTVVCSVTVLAYALFAIRLLEQDESVAIITASHAQARYAPVDNSTLVATLPVGSRVWILERRGPWIYCALPDADRVWLPADSLERVRLKDS